MRGDGVELTIHVKNKPKPSVHPEPVLPHQHRGKQLGLEDGHVAAEADPWPALEHRELVPGPRGMRGEQSNHPNRKKPAT